jgi:hypothetical protein
MASSSWRAPGPLPVGTAWLQPLEPYPGGWLWQLLHGTVVASARSLSSGDELF